MRNAGSMNNNKWKTLRVMSRERDTPPGAGYFYRAIDSRARRAARFVRYLFIYFLFLHSFCLFVKVLGK